MHDTMIKTYMEFVHFTAPAEGAGSFCARLTIYVENF
jgi:hypothetical protein